MTVNTGVTADAAQQAPSLATRLEGWGRSARAWWLVMALAFVLRVGFAFAAPHIGIFEGLVASGSDGYEKIARHLLAGDGYRIKSDLAPTMLRNPLYVAVLAGLFALVGEIRLLGFLLQAGLSVLMIALIRVVGRPVLGAGPAFVAAVLFALYPPDWLATAKYVVEPLLGVLLLCLLMVLPRFMDKPTLGNGALLGLICGLMILAKSVVAYLLPFLFVWMLLWMPSVRERFGRFVLPAVVSLLVCGATLLPWGYYNYQRSGHWVFTSTIAGWALYDGYYVSQHRYEKVGADLWLDARAEGRALAEKRGVYPDPNDKWTFSFFRLEDEVAMSNILKEEAVKGILAAPFSYAFGVMNGLLEFWYAGRSLGSSLIGAAVNLPFVLLALLGIWRARLWRNREVLCWIGIIVYMNLITAMSLAVARYTIPVMPLVFLMGAAALVRVKWETDSGAKILRKQG